MCRLIFLLLLMANIVPYFLEAAEKQCYYGYKSEGYVKVECGKGCFSLNCTETAGRKSQKGCGMCSDQFVGTGCKCTNCTEDLCNKDEDIGSIKFCYEGKPDNFSGNYGKMECDFYNNDACYTKVCNEGKTGMDDYGKSCGKCPDNSFSPACKCKTCKGDMCNNEPVKSKGGNIKKCYGGKIGNYGKENCTILNNDACFTIDCGAIKIVELTIGLDYRIHPFDTSAGAEEYKHCGKCPAELLLPEGCKCTDCVGEMCNKEVGMESDLVSQCYWGDDKKGYETMDCKADGIKNKACLKVKCLGPNPANISNYRDCGRCPSEKWGCKCFQCSDKDLCNAGKSNGSPSSFLVLLAMMGGVMALLAMKPLAIMAMGI